MINLPTLFSGNFSDLAGVPTNLDLDATDDFDGAFGSLSGVPAGLADGDNVNDADASITNEIQDLELDGSTLRITNNSSATDIDLSPFAGTNTDEQDLGFNGSEITITNGDNVDVSGWDLDASDDFDGAFGSLSGVPAGLADGDDINDADADPNNETITNLNLDGTNLEITEAGSTSSINLAGLQDGIGTDDQNLSLASTTLNIEGGSGVDLDGTFATDAELTALDTDDADADPANETITNLDLDGTNLEITEAGNTSSIDLAGLQDGIGTDNQTLSLNPDPQQLVISGGNTLDITGWDLDTSDDFFLPATESFNTGDNILDLTNNGGGITAVFDRNNNAVSNPTLRSFNGGLGPAAEFDQARDGNGDIIVAFRDQGNLVASVNDLGQFVGDGSQLTNLPATLPNQSGNSGRFLTTDGSDASWANVPSSQWSGTNSISFTGEDAAVNAGSSSNPGFSVNRTGTSTNNVGLSINNLVTSPINSPSDKIGLQIISTGAFGTEGGTNIGLDVNVSGGNAQNIAAQFDGGNVVVSNGELRVEETVRISNNTATNFPLFFIDGNFSGDAAMRFSSSNTFTMGVDGSDNIFKISDWTSLGTNDRLSINSGGQVGIGTSSLSASIKMEIENTERYSLWLDNNYTGSSDNYAVFVPNMTGFGSKYAFYQSGTTDENYFAGNVGIGTTDATRKLEVSGTGTQYARITSTSGYPGLEFNTNATNQDWRLSPSAFNSMRVDAGDVDGSMTTVATFWNFSTTLRGILPGSSNTFDLGATSTRWRTIYLVNNPSVSSDQRLKSNIKELDYGLEKILNLKPVSYKMKGQEDNKTHLGLIAQELREVIPEVVHEDNTADKLLSVTYSELIPVTIKAIQEQQNTIKSLERELEELRQKLADSEKYKASLKSQLNEQSTEIDMIKKAIGLQANAKVVNKK
ncbi:MAG: tail fiber domain-containing protein [Fulvivirga sp.]